MAQAVGKRVLHEERRAERADWQSAAEAPYLRPLSRVQADLAFLIRPKFVQNRFAEFSARLGKCPPFSEFGGIGSSSSAWKGASHRTYTSRMPNATQSFGLSR